MWRPAAAECIATFCLIFFGTGALAVGLDNAHTALVFGATVAVMILFFGRISGAHMNPAVTLGAVAAGRLERRRALPYLVAQLVGGLGASLALGAPAGEASVTLPHAGVVETVMLEISFTALLLFSILAVEGSRPAVAALVVGGTLGVEAFLAGPLTGGSFNPVRSLAPAVVSGQMQGLWIYLSAPLMGAGLLAAALRPTRSRAES